MSEQKKHEFKPGKKHTTAKGAHGGGNTYYEMPLKYPKFGLGQGFKHKQKPGNSTENKMP
ncbi:MAG: hypothetical protein QXU32_00545 [Nitrososphaerales archaeon]